MKLHQVVCLLPLFLTSSLTLTLPGTSEIITIPRNGTFVGSECHCEVGKRLTRQRPRKTDCANAIRQLRDNDIHGDFHSDGILNQWRLPETKAHGTCNVTVEMKEGVSDDETSWLGVSNAAAQLNTAVSDLPNSLFPSHDCVLCCMASFQEYQIFETRHVIRLLLSERTMLTPSSCSV